MEVKGGIPILCQCYKPRSKSKPASLPLCLHNWLQAFGIHHSFWNPICKQKTAAAERQSPIPDAPEPPMHAKPKWDHQSGSVVFFFKLTKRKCLVKSGGRESNSFQSHLKLKRVWYKRRQVVKSRATKELRRSKQETKSWLQPRHLYCHIMCTLLSGLTGWWTVEVIFAYAWK